MWDDGRPRYWIDSYDRWHLALPVAFFAALLWLFFLPKPPVVVETAPPAAPPALMAPIIESPVNGAQFHANRMGDVEGRAQSGTLVVLLYAPAQQPWRELGRVVVGSDGRYRFRLAGFPAGLYGLKTVEFADGGRTAESAMVDIWVVAEPKPPVTPPKPRRKTPTR